MGLQHTESRGCCPHTSGRCRRDQRPGGCSCGRAQRRGGPIEEIRPGDVVWIAPGEKHWHGAAPTTAMAHIAVYEALDGQSADWMEEVSEEQYQGR
jgi:hypothetical protein